MQIEDFFMHAQGFVLLEDDHFDPEYFLTLFEEEWEIAPQVETFEVIEDEGVSVFACTISGVKVFMMLIPDEIPDYEAEKNAQLNWMWPEAADVASQHQAHLLVAVEGDDEDVLGRMRVYTQVMSTCLGFDNALGVYTSGTVMAPEFYRETAFSMKRGEIPLPAWVFVGLYDDGEGSCGYTMGMDQFGKDEMEILNRREAILKVFVTLSQIAAYVIENDVVLKDGETLKLPDAQKFAITRSKTVSGFADYSLKIDY